jgi:hypothetical protein
MARLSELLREGITAATLARVREKGISFSAAADDAVGIPTTLSQSGESRARASCAWSRR